ncbi:MAG: DNA gyrase inhibitor YacG [Planctomycetes bacterium]|nr:DNA gyrase inhibitor YacG [Planctomycetota bacterium]MBT6540544.1 DNA gyrase inhibitor YacG [Planctomycetota bacterium]MBT7103639.1 DNA gyrase inhibitor YacG [Planctomycetota bacterium]MBT7130510.1 DNA gyrase inhibitor YacG [Planctomycetota bacterium]MBT7639885.1 DNA gyrase inhibitor YacG [Planctomycetota bacterium]
MTPSTLCPVCKDPASPVTKNTDSFPFCSDRCRDRDLGGWLRNQYKIGSRPVESDDFADGLGSEPEIEP